MVGFAALRVVEAGARGDAYSAGLLVGLRLLLVGSVAFTSFVTGLRHLGWTDARPLDRILADQGANRDLVAALTESDTLCYIRPDSTAFLLSPLLNPLGRDHRYRIIVRYVPADCPAGSAIIR